MDVEARNNENIAEEAAELGDEQLDGAVDKLRSVTVAQAKGMISHLLEVMDEKSSTRVLRIISDLCTTNIAILTDLDPAGVLDGPRAKVHGSIGNNSVQMYPAVSGGFNNETFGAQALGQMMSLVPLVFRGQNIKHLTTAMIEAKKAGMDDLAAELQVELDSVRGKPQEPAIDIEGESEEGSEELRECMYCGKEISRNDEMCKQCSDVLDEGGDPAHAVAS